MKRKIRYNSPRSSKQLSKLLDDVATALEPVFEQINAIARSEIREIGFLEEDFVNQVLGLQHLLDFEYGGGPDEAIENIRRSLWTIQLMEMEGCLIEHPFGSNQSKGSERLKFNFWSPNRCVCDSPYTPTCEEEERWEAANQKRLRRNRKNTQVKK